MRLDNKAIIVTGSTTGIGEAIARRCLRKVPEYCSTAVILSGGKRSPRSFLAGRPFTTTIWATLLRRADRQSGP